METETPCKRCGGTGVNPLFRVPCTRCTPQPERDWDGNIVSDNGPPPPAAYVHRPANDPAPMRAGASRVPYKRASDSAPAAPLPTVPPTATPATTTPAAARFTWTKVAGAWMVKGPAGFDAGAVVTVTNRAGVSKDVTLGLGALNQYGDCVYPVKDDAVKQDSAPKITAGGHVAGPVVSHGVDLSGVPAGRYAVPGGLTRLKLLIQKPTEGKWAGWTFVKDAAVYGEGQRYGSAKPGALYTGKAHDALVAIAADPRAAAAEYGHLTSTCGICGRHLEDEQSVARGIGPVCAANNGW